jgi:murein tripeptide amidase MpaA
MHRDPSHHDPSRRDDTPKAASPHIAWTRLRKPASGRIAAGSGVVLVAALLVHEDPRVSPSSAAADPTNLPRIEHDEVRMAVRIHARNADVRAMALAVALDVWSDAQADDLPIDIVIETSALDMLRDRGAQPEVLVDDIDAVARAEAERLRAPQANKPSDFFAEFKDFTAIAGHLEGLAAQAPHLARLEAIGGSIEGRAIWALRIGSRDPSAVSMLVNGTQHAREWIAAMVTTCVADRLVRGYASDARIRRVLDTTALWIVPVVNPDGYQYSWSSDRYWRKNRRGTHGVDLNRNFAIAFGGAGSSGDRRSEIYRGEHAFSEPESAALRDLVRRESVALHLDFHAYGQLVLYPWTYTPAPAPGRDRLVALADALAGALATRGTKYTPKSGAALYPAAGTMTDWVYGAAGATSFTIELRPKGGSGFVLPPDQIRPTCDEGLAAVLALAEFRMNAKRSPATKARSEAMEGWEAPTGCCPAEGRDGPSLPIAWSQGPGAKAGTASPP